MNSIKRPDGRLLHEDKSALAAAAACVGAAVSICSFSPSLQVWLTGQTSLTMPWWDLAGLRSKWRLVRVLSSSVSRILQKHVIYHSQMVPLFSPFLNKIQLTNESLFMVWCVLSLALWKSRIGKENLPDGTVLWKACVRQTSPASVSLATIHLRPKQGAPAN